MGLSGFIKGGIKAFVLSGGNPAAAAIGAAQGDIESRERKKAIRYYEQQQSERKKQEARLAEIFQGRNLQTIQPNMGPTTTQNAGFGAGFGEFLGDVGRNILSPVSSLFGQIQPFLSRSSVQQPAVTTTANIGAQESQQSGTIQGFMGFPGLGQAIGTASRFLRTPTGQIGTGLGIGAIGSFLGADGKPIRITRKMKAQYRAVLNLAGGDYNMAADMVGVSTDFFISVLLKRFRNDGPVVTKAALRKTKSTVRRLKSMCDMYDSLRPTATRRRAPMKRASTTLISNK